MAIAHYWSSTTQIGSVNNAWAISFQQGLPAFAPKTGGINVRAVRGGS